MFSSSRGSYAADLLPAFPILNIADGTTPISPTVICGMNGTAMVLDKETKINFQDVWSEIGKVQEQGFEKVSFRIRH